MHHLSALLALPLLCLCTGMANAEMRPVTIENDGTNPIYRLYGWPSDLVPRTFNLLTTPIAPGTSRDVKVEDVFGSCVFAFQADFNNPRKPTRPTRIKPKYISLAMRDGIDLCKAGGKVVFR